MSYHKSFSTSDIKSQLKDYRKVRDFSKVKRGEFLKYLVKCDDDNREMLRQKLKRWEKQCKVFDELSECLKNCEDEEQD